MVWQAHQIAGSHGSPGRDHGRDRRGDRASSSPSTAPCRCSRACPAQVAVSRGHLHLGQRGSRPRHSRHRKLVEGDIVSIDTGCKLNGWCGDAAVDLRRRPDRPEVQRLLDVTEGVLDLAIELMGR